MKTTLLLLIFSVSTLWQAPLPDLIGEWKLKKVEINGKTLLPTQKDYFLTISNKRLNRQKGV